MNNDVKMRVNEILTAAGKINGVYDISDESKVRIVVEGCNAGNAVVVRGRIKGQTNFVNLKTLSGAANDTVSVSTYDEVEIECTTFDPTGANIRIVASSFNDASGSAIESIGVPAGDALTDFESFSFTSSDNSVTITGNNTTKVINLQAVTSGVTAYTDTFNATSDWSGPSLGSYSLVYSAATHGKGVTPTLDVYELVSGEYEPVEVPTSIDLSGNITLEVSDSPDIRFQGLIIIR